MSAGKSGTRWSSAQGQVQVETFRVRGSGTTLAAVFEQQKKEPDNRKIALNALRNDTFILSGLQGLKKFYVRGEMKDGEVRGLTVLYDQATEGIMDPVVVVMSSAFAPFPGGGLTAFLGPPPRRKVEYATGIVVSARKATSSPIGRRPKAATWSRSRALATPTGWLKTRFGAGVAASLWRARFCAAGDAGRGRTRRRSRPCRDCRPAVPGRCSRASTVVARLNGDAVGPAPQLGFAGAAALDRSGRFLGMVALKTPVLASAAANAPPPQATLVGPETVRAFLETQAVPPAAGRPGADAIKAALVRVICVRK